jgi:hypothetical protein
MVQAFGSTILAIITGRRPETNFKTLELGGGPKLPSLGGRSYGARGLPPHLVTKSLKNVVIRSSAGPRETPHPCCGSAESRLYDHPWEDGILHALGLRGCSNGISAFLPWSLCAPGFQRPLPWPMHPPSLAAIASRLLTRLRLGVAPVALFHGTLWREHCQRRQTISEF